MDRLYSMVLIVGVLVFSVHSLVVRTGRPGRPSRPRLTTWLPALSTGPKSSGRHPASWDQQPGESNSAYMKRLQTIASNAKSFEQMVLHSNNASFSQPDNGRQGGAPRSEGTAPSALSNHTDTSTPSAKSGYQRAEDWDREMNGKNGSLTWEEKVQFDGQRHGNRFHQNEILRRHMGTFF